MIRIQNFINGEFIEPVKKDYLNTFNPATGQVFGYLPDSSLGDLSLAIDAAEKAFPAWSQLAIEKRSEWLMKIADLIDANLDRLAAAESLDNGKPISLAKSLDIPRAAANFRFFAAAIVNQSSDAHIMEGVAVNYTRRAPIGVVGCISPWNLPLYLLTWKIAPALASGNCVIAKPSEVTPYTAYLLSELFVEAGFPPGVFNVLHGNGQQIGQALVAHERVKAISFTGGTATGKIIGAIAAERFKKVSLELGGKNPVLIFDDCDLEEAVAESVKSAFTNQGEICLCGSRIFVQQTIYDAFKEKFVKQVAQLEVGMPEKNVDLGPLVSQAHLQKVCAYVTQAREQGGVVLTGGQEIPGDGYFYPPTVLEGLDEHCQINQEEVFGPVVTLIPFTDEVDAVSKANSTPYGLASVIWTSDLKKAHRVAHQMNSGIVWVNCWLLRDLRTPFGGMKNSGVGREGGEEALRFFTETQNICIKL